MRTSAPRLGRILGKLLLAAAVASGASCASPVASGPAFEGHDLRVWSDYLVADQAESAWREIPWIPTLAEGVRAATEADRPMLLWMMNGHPLGCT